MHIRLPLSTGVMDYEMNAAGPLAAIPGIPACSRVAYAAAHVVLDPASAGVPRPTLDMEATLAFRRRLWSLGLGVAEAMDTAQRGMGLDWEMAKELIRQSALEAGACKGAIACGANTDQLANGTAPTLNEVLAAYEEQCAFIENCGAQVILMASRALVCCAQGADDYHFIYGRLLSQLKRPAILHWLGEAFDPQLKGYWGEVDAAKSMEIVLELIAANRGKIDGIKISLLDRGQEIEMRRRLPEGVRMYSGEALQPCTAGNLRRHCAGCGVRPSRTRPRRLGNLRCGFRAHAPAFTPYLSGTHLQLQGGARFFGLSQRLSGSISYAGRVGKSAFGDAFYGTVRACGSCPSVDGSRVSDEPDAGLSG
jgi:hypothetical protein